MPYIATNSEAIVLVKKNRIIELWASLIQAKIDQLRTEPNYEKRNDTEENILEHICKLEEV